MPFVQTNSHLMDWCVMVGLWAIIGSWVGLFVYLIVKMVKEWKEEDQEE